MGGLGPDGSCPVGDGCSWGAPPLRAECQGQCLCLFFSMVGSGTIMAVYGMPSGLPKPPAPSWEPCSPQGEPTWLTLKGTGSPGSQRILMDQGVGSAVAIPSHFRVTCVCSPHPTVSQIPISRDPQPAMISRLPPPSPSPSDPRPGRPLLCARTLAP